MLFLKQRTSSNFNFNRNRLPIAIFVALYAGFGLVFMIIRDAKKVLLFGSDRGWSLILNSWGKEVEWVKTS